jgi:hypothetical protein
MIVAKESSVRIKTIGEKFRRWRSQTYLRGRTAYVGDRRPDGCVSYLYEGYAGANLGDELVYETTVGFLAPAHPIFVGRFRPPIEALRCWCHWDKPKAIVFGGGTCGPDNIWKDPRFGGHQLPLFAFGVGNMEFTDGAILQPPEARLELWQRFFDKVDPRSFGVRGPRSLAFFSRILPDVTITGDTALAAYDFISRRKGSFIGVNIGNHRRASSEAALVRYANIVGALGSLELPIVLIPLHEQDRATINNMLLLPNRTWPRHLSHLDYVPSTTQWRSLLGTMAMGVGERLHFSIPLFASGIPALMLAYSDKHHDFAESINGEEFIIKLTEDAAAQVSEKARQIAENGFEINPSIAGSISILKQRLLASYDSCREWLQLC